MEIHAGILPTHLMLAISAIKTSMFVLMYISKLISYQFSFSDAELRSSIVIRFREATTAFLADLLSKALPVQSKPALDLYTL